MISGVPIFKRARAAVEDARNTVGASMIVAVIALMVAMVALFLGVRFAHT